MERITLNMVPTGVLEICHASQYDIGREIRFDLIDGTDDFVLSGDEDITIFIRDFDGNLIESSAPNTSSNYVVWTSSEGELDVSGPAICELRVTKDDDVLGSANFIMEIEADPYADIGIHVETVGPADICTFETTLPEPLQSVIVDVEATGGNGTPDNPNPINGYSEANIIANGNTHTIAFGQTVYGGVLDVTRGKASVNYARAKIRDLNWYYSSGLACFNTTDLASVVKGGNVGLLCECESTLNVPLSTASINANNNFIRFNLKADGTAETGNFAVGALVLKDTDYSDVASMLSSLGDYYVLYELATPIDIDLTPEVISAIVGENNVFAGCGQSTVKYLKAE